MKMAARQFVLILALLSLAFASPIQEPDEQLAGEDTTSGPAQTDICKGQSDGLLLPDHSCKECFYECNFHLAYRFHCPPGLIFSETGLHKGCQVDPAAPTQATPCTMNSHFDCKGKADGFYPDPSSTNKFHECVHGCGADFDCPPTTAFDSSRNVCAFDSNFHPPTLNPVTPAPTQPHHEDTTPTHWVPQDTTPTPVHHEDTTPTHWVPQDTTPTQVHHEDTTPTHWIPQDTTPTLAPHEDTTPTHWTPDPWTPEHHTDPETTVHHEEVTTPTQHHEEVTTPTQPPVHHEDTTQPPIVTPPTNEQSTRGRHSDTLI